jgi:PAS domain S-box-containing protein
LREGEQLARGIIETALDAFVQMDEDGNIADWNTQAEKIFGWSRSEAIGRKLAELIVPDYHRAAHRAGLEHFRFTGEGRILGRRMEIEALRRNGQEVKVELSITQLKRRDGIVFNGFIRDLTDRIAAEDRIRHAEKMEAVGQLTGGIAHDFNNLLTAVLGSLEMLRKRLPDDPKSIALLENAAQGAQRGTTLTKRMLAFARNYELKQEVIGIPELVRGMTELLQRSVGSAFNIETRFPLALKPIEVDANQLELALLNLTLNARDAMPDGGVLTLARGGGELVWRQNGSPRILRHLDAPTRLGPAGRQDVRRLGVGRIGHPEADPAGAPNAGMGQPSRSPRRVRPERKRQVAFHRSARAPRDRQAPHRRLAHPGDARATAAPPPRR